jgi:hypothetical protein
MKPKKAPPEEAAVRGLSNSERQTFTTCRQKWYWQYHKLYSPGATPTPFLVGTAFHTVLKSFYTGGDCSEEAVVSAVDEVFEPAVRGEGAAFLSPDQLDDLEKQRVMAHGMCLAYVKVHAADLKKWKVLKVEEKGRWSVNQRWQMFFTVDLLVEAEDGVWVVEHKTTSAIDANYVARLSLDEQVSTYMVGVRRAWDIAPKGVIYNVVLKPRIRQKQNETREGYLERVLALYKDQAAEYLYREKLLCSARDLARFEEELHLFTGEIEHAEATGYFPKNTRACDVRGTCPCLPLCAEGEEAAKDRFVVRERRSQYDEEQEA